MQPGESAVPASKPLSGVKAAAVARAGGARNFERSGTGNADTILRLVDFFCMATKKQELVPAELIDRRIYLFRGHRVNGG